MWIFDCKGASTPSLVLVKVRYTSFSVTLLTPYSFLYWAGLFHNDFHSTFYIRKIRPL